MQIACPHCRQRMDVPEVFLSRLTKCTHCKDAFTPQETLARRPAPAGRNGHAPPAAPKPAAADYAAFHGMHTEHNLLVDLCERARTSGDEGRFHFLAAYANAQTALKRDTWQAALLEWQMAHGLLGKTAKLHDPEAVDRARREFVALASDQLTDFIHQMQREFQSETAHLPPTGRKHRAAKIAAAFRHLLRPGSQLLLDPAMSRHVEKIATEWDAQALDGRAAARHS